MAAGKFEGFVKIQGVPTEGATVKVFRESNDAKVATTVTDGVGFFRARGLDTNLLYWLKITDPLDQWNPRISARRSPVIDDVEYDPYFYDLGMLAHFDGADGSNIFIDSSREGRLFTLSGVPIIDTGVSQFGGSSLYLDGSSSMTVADSTDFAFGSGDFTIEMWVKPTTFTGNQTLISKWGGGGNRSWDFLLIGPAAHFRFSNDGSTQPVAISTGNLVVDAWNHVAVVRSGDVFTIYLNGGGGETATNSGVVYTSGTPVAIGVNQDGGVWRFTGHIDDVRVTKGVARYMADFTVPTTPFPGPISGTVLPTAFDYFNKGPSITLSDDNVYVGGGHFTSSVKTVHGVSSGKFYWEATEITRYGMFGIGNTSAPVSAASSAYPGRDTNGWGLYVQVGESLMYHGDVAIATGLPPLESIAVMGFALDMDTGVFDIYVNNSLVYTTAISPGTYFAMFATGASAAAYARYNFGRTPFAYSPPAGYAPGLGAIAP